MLFYLFFLLGSVFSFAEEQIFIDSLVARVGRDAILQSDLTRFQDVRAILLCAGALKGPATPVPDRKALLDVYIEEELMYLEARSKKISTAGLIPKAVRMVHRNEDCKTRWQKLGQEYSKIYRTESRAREGESLLVRELEKRVLVERFRTTELIADGELWKREVRARYPVKVYIE